MNPTHQSFTVEAALQIQLKQITELRPILSDGAFDFLLREVAKRNAAGYQDGYSVFRGQDLFSYVECNYKA